MNHRYALLTGLLLLSLTTVPVSAQTDTTETTPPKKEVVQVSVDEALSDQVSKMLADGKGTLVYGNGYVYALRTPEGWIADNESGKADSLQWVLYPENATWKSSKAVMYVNATSKPASGINVVQHAIASDTEKFKARFPNMVVKEGDSLETQDKRTANIRYFTGDEWGNHEAVAYIEEPKAIALLTLSTKSEQDFNAALPLFQAWVKSHLYVTDTYTLE